MNARTRKPTPFRSPLVALVVAASALALGGCSILGGGGERERATIFSPDPRVAADPSWPTVDWQLALNTPSAARTTDTYRIAVRPSPGELQVYRGASWARSTTDMVQDTLLRTLEDSGRITGVARRGAGVAPDYRLEMDLRRFEADYAGNAVPAATIELNAKLLHTVDQKIVASRTFLQAEPAAGTDIAQVADAFSRSLGAISHEVAGWVLASGEAHEKAGHPAPPPR